MIKHTLARTFLALAALGAMAGAATSTTSAAQAAPRTEVVTFRIAGMVTDRCPVLVSTALSRADGVTSVSTDLEKKTAVVRYVPEKTTPEKLAALIESRTGFEARVIDRR